MHTTGLLTKSYRARCQRQQRSIGGHDTTIRLGRYGSRLETEGLETRLDRRKRARPLHITSLQRWWGPPYLRTGRGITQRNSCRKDWGIPVRGAGGLDGCRSVHGCESFYARDDKGDQILSAENSSEATRSTVDGGQEEEVVLAWPFGTNKRRQELSPYASIFPRPLRSRPRE